MGDIMSRIALSAGNAGIGTFTIESPETEIDRTITLPDADGILVTTNNIAPSVGNNLFINGGFDIWQRGTAFANTQAIYMADRWKQTSTGNPLYTFVRNRLTDLTGDDVPTTPYYGELDWTTNPDANIGLQNRIEDVNKLSNQLVTLSFYAISTGGTDAAGEFFFRSNTDSGSGNLDSVTQVFTVTQGAWKRYEFQVQISDISGIVAGANSYTQLSMSFQDATGTVQLSAFKLEQGFVATPFSTQGSSIGAELALCQRYYQEASDGNYFMNAAGVNPLTTQVSLEIQFPVQMRIAPTVAITGSGNVSAVAVGAKARGIQISGTATNTSFARIDSYTADAEL
jgi:hypothetical protein